jgi:hypothetical protein
MLAVFAFTLFVSATLLFLVQPMVGKMMLPLLGGNPAVWNTCMVFFQAVLLLGYAYAHAASKWLGVRHQALLHLGLLLLPLVQLFVFRFQIARGLLPAGESNPVPYVLAILLVSVGLPFFAVSTSAPLLQKWFSATGHPAAGDPYFLYGASNLGSMLALALYPLLIEPNLRLADQTWLWTVGYGVLVVLTACCAFLLWRAPEKVSGQVVSGSEEVSGRVVSGEESRGKDHSPLTTHHSPLTTPTAWQRLHWVGLAFVPSSLMLGVTTYITTDIASIPLLWVLPLGLYLLSFILVFSRLPGVVHQVVVVIMPMLVLLLVFLIVSNLGQPNISVLILLHCAVLFVVAMCCHGELARRRPAAEHLTEFYLLLSVGGVLGGLFNALLAPLVFNDLYEYVIALILACLLLPRPPWSKPAEDDSERGRQQRLLSRALDLVLPLTVGLFSLWLIVVVPVNRTLTSWLRWLTLSADWLSGGRTDVKLVQVQFVLIFGLPPLLCYLFVNRPLRFGLAVAAFWLVSLVPGTWDPTVLHKERSFFGVLQVNTVGSGYYRRLIHGTTVHGEQQMRLSQEEQEVMVGAGVCPLAAAQPLELAALLAAARDQGRDPRRAPIAYYHRDGPIGQLMAAFPDPRRNLAVIGLGTGSMAAYGQPGQRLTYFEIDSAVLRLSGDVAGHKPYFTYVKEAKQRGVDLRILLGDARLVLERTDLAEDEKYHLLVVDAFSSDAIPMHLITREAMRLYVGKLAPGGIVAFHISNRYLNLAPVLGNIAEAEKLATLVIEDTIPQPGKFISNWVLLARDVKDFGDRLPIAAEPDPGEGHRKPGVWYPEVERRPWVGVWSDDFSNVLGVFRWQN